MPYTHSEIALLLCQDERVYVHALLVADKRRSPLKRRHLRGDGNMTLTPYDKATL